jgi:hypothetical protein
VAASAVEAAVLFSSAQGSSSPWRRVAESMQAGPVGVQGALAMLVAEEEARAG